ncbi:uncharacterized protein LOC134820340 [Bolinopsis microptera]|uniref:uncharacterized protein LOC134820340 n=1 Tax=Bolinopsis microptera TaxID=2820187 RepID=UPI003078C97A
MNKLLWIGNRVHAMESAITVRRLCEDKFTMFPRAPNLSKFIDAFHRNETDLNKKEKLEKRRQEEYHAEVQVFRALENLKVTQSLDFVLHNLRYTHGQYGYFVDDHDVNCSKKPQEEEGECDFVAVVNSCFVVFEVKSPNKESKNRPKMFRDRLKESIVQRKRTVKLLQGMAKRYGLSYPFPVILDFTIFCGLTREEAGSLTQSGSNLAEDLSEIVFEDDLPNFTAWWDVNVMETYINSCSTPGVWSLLANNKTLYQKNMEAIGKMQITFLGLWISHMHKENPSSLYRQVPEGSLPHCIIEIDKVLRSEIITRKPSGPINREIRGAPPVFKNHLGIECLTVEQMNIFKCEEKHICINDPAGSGKTVVLLGKMLELAKKEQKSERKILVLAFGEYSAERYKKACDSASINNLTIPLTTENLPQTDKAPLLEQQDVYLMVKQCMIKCVQDSFQEKPLYKVAIMYNLANLLSIVKLDIFSLIFDLFPDHHILVDDGQCIFSHNWESVSEEDVHSFLEHLKKIAVVQETDVWLSYDPVQYYYNKLFQCLPSRVGPSPLEILWLWLKQLNQEK